MTLDEHKERYEALVNLVNKDKDEIKSICDTQLQFERAQDYIWERHLRTQHHSNRILIFIARLLLDITTSKRLLD